MGEAEEGGGGTGGDPGVAAEFAFELAGGPSGVADEGADEGAGAVGVLDGVVRGDAEGPAELCFLPPEGGEGEVFAGDGAALMDGDFEEWGELFFLEEVADGVAGGLVHDEAECALVGGVFGEEDDGTVEDAVAEGGVREEELAVEADGGVWCG